MADLTFEQAVLTIVGMKDEIVRALGRTFVMVGLSIMIAAVFDTLSDVLLFVTSSCQLHYNKPVNFLLGNLISLMRTFPFVILMITMVPATRVIVGSTISPIATSLVLSAPGLLHFARLVEQSPHEIPKGVIEAVTAMGTPPLTIVRKALLNEARAGMIPSITVLVIGLLSYSAAAGMAGGGGLGGLAIRYGYYCHQTEVTISIVILLVLLVILIQSTDDVLVRKLDER